MVSVNTGQTDNILQFVNKNFISLNDDDKKHYMKHYQLVLDHLLELMKINDELFASIYRRLYWAGSYYDGLKVGKPEEFDVDVVMKLPIDYSGVEFINKKIKPPFTTVKMTSMEQLKHHPKWTSTYRFMDAWTDKNGLLLQGPFREWMESAVNKGLDKLPKENLSTRKLEINGEKYLISLKKTGPAMTLNITIPDGTKLDVDFVPVIEFKYPQQWPAGPVRSNMVPSRESWFIVPKPNSRILSEYKDTYWRLAFHDQEREMINDKGRLKPVCRLLKKLRDNNSALKSIASYYLKTLFLWDILDKKSDPTYWTRITLTSHFMSMLKMLLEQIKLRKINYFWDDRYNLLSGMSDIEMSNCEGRLNKIIKDIENKSSSDPKIIAKYILTTEEYNTLVNSQNSKELSRSPSVVVEKENQVPIAVETKAIQSRPTNATSLDAIMEILNTMQQELVQQKKVTQTVLAKVNILQSSIDKLTDDNASLRDELKLIKQLSKEKSIGTSTLKDVDLIMSLDMANDGYSAVADKDLLRNELKLSKELSKDLSIGTRNDVDFLLSFEPAYERHCTVPALLN